LNHNILLCLGLIFFTAFISKNFSRILKIPEVTGYVLIGVIMGNILSISFGKINFEKIIDSFDIISTIALGIIGFTIGLELKLDIIKKLGKSIIFIVILEAFGAFFIVFISLLFFNKIGIFPDIKMSVILLLSAVASATAPAATVAVIRQYKAKGILTSAILAVVGIDDAIALLIYAFASNFSKSLILGSKITYLYIILKTIGVVILSILVGSILSLVYMYILKKIRSEESITILLTAFLLSILGISEVLHLSELLAVMSFGAVTTNLSHIIAKKSEKITEFFTPLFLAAFFLLGGAHLELIAVKTLFGVSLVYFISRTTGKIFGGNMGAKLGRAPDVIKKYIGFSLIPQVGVALALALSIRKDFMERIFKNGIEVFKYGKQGERISFIVINILLITTIVTEIVGPILTRYVLKKSGEINEEGGEN